MSWTDERVELLKKLWAEGLSASQIAQKMGGITRNAVIGKVHRLGLSGRATPARSSAPRVRKQRSASTGIPGGGAGKTHYATAGATALKVQPQATPEAEPSPIREVMLSSDKKVSILDLSDKTCRWPNGEPGTESFHFCGHAPKPGMPYCEYHARIAFQPLHDRRRTKRTAGGSA